jgi:hypothetical protein
VNGIVVVDPASIQKWSRGEPNVTQSIYIMAQQLNKWSQFKNACTFANATLANIYPNTKIETNRTNFSPKVQGHTSSVPATTIVAEFIVTGDRVTVHQQLEEIVADINQAQQMTFSNVGSTALATAFGCPPASLSMLQQVDPGIAARVQLATDPRRATSAIRNDIINGSRPKRIMALMNIMLNEFGIVVKGGPVRDIIVCGKSGPNAMNDMDAELRAGFNASYSQSGLTPSNFKQVIGRWESMLSSKYGVQIGAMTSSPHHTPRYGPDGLVWGGDCGGPALELSVHSLHRHGL